MIDFTTISQDVDGGSSVAVIQSWEMGLRDVLRALDLNPADRFSRPANKERARWVGNGLWGMRKTDAGSVFVSVNVGCTCEHDCCGHICGLDFEIMRRESGWVIVHSWRRNF